LRLIRDTINDLRKPPKPQRTGPRRREGMINTTKKISALRQILAALEHFEKKNYECAITLAAVGEGQCKEKTTTHLFRLIRAKFGADETNAVINWLKHPSGPNAAEITE
jgi:hypothetical protein